MENHPTRWKPGKSGNPNGRPKGSKNKFTKDVKEKFREVFGVALKDLERDLQSMSPEKRWQIILTGMRYVMAEKKGDTKVKNEVEVTVKYESKQLEDSNTLDITDFQLLKDLGMNEGRQKKTGNNPE
ncbi:MAG: DUF5681 domain-containing protein [Flavisolibacter sp.]